MNDAWQWWLALLFVALGAGVFWLMRGSLQRREEDVEASERAAEAAWIAEELARSGQRAEPEVVERVLELHRSYLGSGATFPTDEEPLNATLATQRESGDRTMPPGPSPAPSAATPATDEEVVPVARDRAGMGRASTARPERDVPAAG